MTVDPRTLTVVLYPDNILRAMAEAIDPTDANVQAVVSRMMELMRAFEGVGLAAPQVGLPWRVFVTRDPENEAEAVAWINPTLEIIDNAIESAEEGCLSLPHIHGQVKRPTGIKISGWDCNGNPSSASSDAFIARVWQHENDHLDGVLIIDKMSAMDRLVNRRAIKNLERAV